jgi:equilibrative nucleoside transporter 1/2/3
MIRDQGNVNLGSEIDEEMEPMINNNVPKVKENPVVLMTLFAIFGIAMLGPWNVWIQLVTFFNEKLAGTRFQGSFQGYITVTYQLVNTIMLLAFLMRRDLITPKMRVISGLLVIAVVFAISVPLASSSLNPTTYFMVVLLCVAATSVGSAFLAALVGLSYLYPSFCITLLNTGQGLSGVFPSLIQLMDPSEDGNVSNIASTHRTFYLGAFFALVSLLGYFYLTRGQLNVEQSLNTQSSGQILDDDAELDRAASLSVRKVFDVIVLPAISVFLNFAVTLSLFPYVTSHIVSQTGWSDILLLHFLVFNVFDLLGKSITILKSFRISSHHTLFKLTISRILFIPLILSCNLIVYDKQSLPIARWIPWVLPDFVYLFLVGFIAFTNGISS